MHKTAKNECKTWSKIFSNLHVAVPWQNVISMFMTMQTGF